MYKFFTVNSERKYSDEETESLFEQLEEGANYYTYYLRSDYHSNQTLTCLLHGSIVALLFKNLSNVFDDS